VPALQLLGLFSKESAATLPLLLLCTTLFTSRANLARSQWIVLGVCAAMIAVWLALRQRFLFGIPPEYEPTLGLNVLRNLGAMLAWGLNVPREALRMIVIGPRHIAVLWAAAAALPMIAFLLSLRSKRLEADRARRAVCVVAFVIAAYAPYIVLRWQSYEYYAQVAAVLPAIVIGHVCTLVPRARVALVLLGLSSVVAVEGSRAIAYPGLIARAHLGEQQIDALVQQEMTDPDVAEAPLAVQVADPHRFYAIGRAGLAWRLGRAPAEVILSEGCARESTRLVDIRATDVGLYDCAADEDDEIL
jgi:hypothetical protein